MSSENEALSTQIKPNTVGVRHIQALLFFLTTCGILLNRTTLTVAIVPMINNSSNPVFPAYDWDEATRGFLFSGASCGFLISLLPGGLLSHWFGAKYVIIIAHTISSIAAILIPIMAQFGWPYVLVLYGTIGLMGGSVFPSLFTLAAKWIHPSERGLSIFMNSGRQFGIFAIMMISGPIALSSIGWPGIYYTAGGTGFIIVIAWIVLGYESPATHKYISDNERKYLQLTKGITTKERLPIPWISVIKSPPFLSLTLAISAQNFGFFVLLTQIPTYLNAIFQFSLLSTGILSGLPYLTMGIFVFFIAPLSDFLINRQYLTREVTRKLFNTIGQWIPVICLLALALIVDLSGATATILLIIAVGTNAGASGGCLINHLDLSPNFSGTIYAMSFISASILSTIAPLFVGFVVDDLHDRSKWNIVFYVTAGLYFIGNLSFIIFGKANIQKWNEGKNIAKNDEYNIKTDNI